MPGLYWENLSSKTQKWKNNRTNSPTLVVMLLLYVVPQHKRCQSGGWPLQPVSQPTCLPRSCQKCKNGGTMTSPQPAAFTGAFMAAHLFHLSSSCLSGAVYLYRFSLWLSGGAVHSGDTFSLAVRSLWEVPLQELSTVAAPPLMPLQSSTETAPQPKPPSARKRLPSQHGPNAGKRG